MKVDPAIRPRRHPRMRVSVESILACCKSRPVSCATPPKHYRRGIFRGWCEVARAGFRAYRGQLRNDGPGLYESHESTPFPCVATVLKPDVFKPFSSRSHERAILDSGGLHVGCRIRRPGLFLDVDGYVHGRDVAGNWVTRHSDLNGLTVTNDDLALIRKLLDDRIQRRLIGRIYCGLIRCVCNVHL